MKMWTTKTCMKHDKPIVYEFVTCPKRKTVFEEVKIEFHECPACKQVREIKQELIKYKEAHMIENPHVTSALSVIDGYDKRYQKTLECQGCKNMPGYFKCLDHRTEEENEVIRKTFNKKAKRPIKATD